MRILFLTDNFPPEVNAPATRTYEHCREWVKQGADVTVITCAPNFPRGKVFEGYQNKYAEESIDGIRVIRVRTYIAANKGTVRRSLDYLSFYFAAIRAGRRLDCDVIIGTSPQFFTVLAAKRLAKFRKKPWIMEVRDIWPESIKVVEAVRESMIIRYLEKKEIQCYDSAEKIVCVTRGIYNRLKERGVPEGKLKVFTNGSNLEKYFPREKNAGLLKKFKLEKKSVVGYVGTMGLSHKLDFILRCAFRIEDPSIHFLLVGEGAEKENLLRLKSELGLKNVTITDGIPKTAVPEYLSVIDIALINLKKKDLFLGALPSKIFENAAMGKPLLLGLQGEAQRVVEKYRAGLSFEPENEDDFIEKLRILKRNKEFYKQCADGCIKLAKDYDRKKIAANMLEYIKTSIE
ncbi:MAG: glycosyltransferase family 4 protein [Fidelibacterota bacterium]